MALAVAVLVAVLAMKILKALGVRSLLILVAAGVFTTLFVLDDIKQTPCLPTPINLVT